MTDRIVPGTANLPRYPGKGYGGTGILHYGRSGVNGYAGCYKVGRDNALRLESLGYLIVKVGSGYCYAYKS